VAEVWGALWFDVGSSGPIFEEFTTAAGLQRRVRFGACDFFADPLPSAEVAVLGHFLRDRATPDTIRLLRAAFDAPSRGGRPDRV
jgi:hypothetical protein